MEGARGGPVWDDGACGMRGIDVAGDEVKETEKA